MIKLVKVEKAESSGQIWMTSFIDAKAAGIKVRHDAALAENEIGKRLVAQSQAVTGRRDTDEIEQEFREYLRDGLFKHYVDILSINDYIYESRQVFIQYRQNIVLAGFNMVYKYSGKVEEDV